MKRRLGLLTLLVWLAAPTCGQAAYLQTQTSIRSGPAAPVPVISPVLSPLSAPGASSLSVPMLRASLPVLQAPVPVLQAAVMAPALASPITAPSVQAAPAQSTLSSMAQKLAAPSQAAAEHAPVEMLSAQAARTFDGSNLQAQAPVAEVPAAVAAASPKPLRLIITGPPGSGKGTYSEKITQEYGVVHISVGELLRAYAKSHPEIASVMAQGKLVDSGLVLRVVQERLAQPDIREHGFILDGFPRRGEEAAALEKILGSAAIDGVIQLDVPEAELLRRILARGRADDKADVFRERMKIYREQTVPAVERFKSASPVLAPEVSGSDIATNYSRVKQALTGLIDKLLGR